MQSPPVPARRESIVERWFDVPVEDPYRWLEQAGDPEVERFVDAQNQLTERWLSHSADRPRIRQRLAELFRIGTLSLPLVRRSKAGALRLFYSRREAGDEQPILYVRDGLRDVDRKLVDPASFGAGAATSALDWYEPSEDGSLLAYGISQSGSEDSVLRIRDVATGRDLPDVIDRTRFASIAWAPDGKRFFYTRYPKPGSVPEQEARYHRKIYSHVIGTNPEHDPLVFGADLLATDFPNCVLSPNGRWLVITVNRGWSESFLFLADLQKGTSFTRITPDEPQRYAAIARNDRLFVMTDQAAPNQRIFAIDPEKPGFAHWKLLIPEHATWVVKNFEVVRDEILIAYLDGGISRLERFEKSGKHKARVELSALGTSDGFSGLPDGTEGFFAYESFATPPEVHQLDLETGKAERWEAVKANIRSEDYDVDARFARSRDGTLVPYHLVRRRDIDLTRGDNPTLLYGYGGFNDTMEPRFSRSVQVFLEQGGIYAQALLRGGGEFGEGWHRAGQLDKKQNTFDDFIAIAEHLQSERVTDRDHLAIYGRSNGGLLVAAVATQRPDLFRAGVAGVPLTDMLRYPKFLIGRLWETEYGSPAEEKGFRSLLAYSPYHNVRNGTRYPALLVTTAESDTRVDPLHARKFVAALQSASSSGHPILLRTERASGHGAGTPVSKQVLELSDVYAFLFAELGLSAAAPLRSDDTSR